MRLVSLDSLQQFAAVNLSEDLGAIGGHVHVPQCAQIGIQWFLPDGKIGHNILYGRYSGPFGGSQAQANSIMTSLTTGTAWTTLATFLHTNTALAAVTIRDVNPEDGSGQLIQSSNASVPGTGTGSALPSEVAAVLTKRTAKAGRQFRGRVYVPGFATVALGLTDTITAAAVTALTNWGGTFGSAMLASGYTHVLGLQARAAYTSPKTGTHFDARPAQSVDVVSTTCRDNHWDSQRKRGLK